MTRAGFSLVELSIVLVILGLLTGGILAGQSLIRASELRAVSTEYQRYITATQTFRDKYFAIPGDFRDATRFWARMAGTADCVTNSSAATNASGSCDGNGNGLLTYAAASESGEVFHYWRQLALAGLVEGTYTGVAGSGFGAHSIIGTNVPRSKLGNAGWSVDGVQAPAAGNASFFATDYGNVFFFGTNTANNVTAAGAIKPEEAWNIDTKMDDGRPAYGAVMTGKLGATFVNACATTAVESTAEYALTTTSNCTLIFKTKF